MAVAESAEFVLTRQQAGEIAFEQTLDECQAGVKYLAGRLANRLPAHVDVEDLIQVGLLGLLQCVQRFDARRGVKFQTYANRRVQGAMLDYLRSLDWRPRSVRKRSRRLAEAVAAVEQRTGASASEEELASEMGMTSTELRQWLADYSSRGEHAAVTQFERGSDENPDDLLALIADPADSPETQVENKQLGEKLAEAIQRLPENERVVCSLYYFEQRTMKQIGRVLGVKQARVSQLHSQALRRLRLRMRRDARPFVPPVNPPVPMPAALDEQMPCVSVSVPEAACEAGCAA
jgi:RNA polymerase sigma factor for flagellar operon FliA